MPNLPTILMIIHSSEGQSKAFKKLEANTSTMGGNLLAAIRQHNAPVQREIQQLRKDISRYVPKNTHVDQSTSAYTINHTILANCMLKNDSSIKTLLQTVDKTSNDQALRPYRTNIMNSLWFQRMDDRQNMIDNKHQETLNWIFEPPPGYNLQWSSVPEWLRGSDSLYWVSEKAGSGKSTLMKWLYHDSRTRDTLQIWAGKKMLFLLRCYFWISGKDEAQKSLSGLLRSILYDLLQQCPDLILHVFSSQWRSYDLELAHSPP